METGCVVVLQHRDLEVQSIAHASIRISMLWDTMSNINEKLISKPCKLEARGVGRSIFYDLKFLRTTTKGPAAPNLRPWLSKSWELLVLLGLSHDNVVVFKVGDEIVWCVKELNLKALFWTLEQLKTCGTNRCLVKPRSNVGLGCFGS